MELRDPKWLRGASSPGQLDRKPVGKRAAARGAGATSQKTTLPNHQGSKMGTLLWPQGLFLPTGQVSFIRPRCHPSEKPQH